MERRPCRRRDSLSDTGGALCFAEDDGWQGRWYGTNENGALDTTLQRNRRRARIKPRRDSMYRADMPGCNAAGRYSI